MMMEQGVVLGHIISAVGIQVDPGKVKISLNFPTLKTHIAIRSLIGYVGYY